MCSCRVHRCTGGGGRATPLASSRSGNQWRCYSSSTNLLLLLIDQPTHYSLLTTHYSLLTTHYSLLTTHYLLLTTHYSLLTTHCSLQVVFLIDRTFEAFLQKVVEAVTNLQPHAPSLLTLAPSLQPYVPSRSSMPS